MKSFYLTHFRVVNIIKKKENYIKTEERIFNTAESIEDAQRAQVALENAQYDLWQNLKKAVATQIDVKPARTNNTCRLGKIQVIS